MPEENAPAMVRFVREDAVGKKNADVAVAPRSTFDSLYKGQGYVEIDDSGKAVTKAAAKTGGDA